MSEEQLKQIAKEIPDQIFRGYDLRGVTDVDLNVDRVYVIGRAYATWLLRRRIYDCVVGHDSRLTSPEYTEALIRGLNDAGVTVYDLGMTLSQIVYFGAYYFRTKGYVMVTASHNPKEYNGFKFGTGYSDTMVTDEIIQFRDLVHSGEFETHGEKGEHLKRDIFVEYVDDLFKRVEGIGKFKVVVDACAATPGLFLPTILRRAGCEVIEQNTTPDGNFPVGTANPVDSFVTDRLAKRVLEENADLGFAYDCDGDRVGIVDGEGNTILNDTLASIFSKDILMTLPGAKIVYNNLCSKQVSEVIVANGGVPIMWMTGHSFIKAKVREERAIFGGELSGHFFFVDNFYGHDDSAIASLRLLAYLTKTGQSLKDVVDTLPQYYSTPNINCYIAEEIKFSFVKNTLVPKVKELFSGAEFNEIDGIRIDTADEMFIIRPSQNGAYLSMKFETRTAEQYEVLKKKLRDFLTSFSELDFHHPTMAANVEVLFSGE
jgi:phosphomannomutase / phosphoglucomutase